MKNNWLSTFVLFCCCLSMSNGSAASVTVLTELSPPYQTIEKGKVSGSATELVEAYLAKANVDYQIEVYPWSRAYKTVISEPNSLIYSIAKTPTRMEQFHWLIPIYHFKPYLVGLAGKEELRINSVEAAKEHLIAVQRSDFAYDYLLSLGFKENVNLVLTSSIVDSWHLLVNGRVDFIVEDLASPPILEGQRPLLLSSFEKYFPIKALHQETFLAANKNIDKEILKRLIEALPKQNK